MAESRVTVRRESSHGLGSGMSQDTRRRLRSRERWTAIEWNCFQTDLVLDGLSIGSVESYHEMVVGIAPPGITPLF